MSAVEHRQDYYFISLRHEYIIICKNCTYRKSEKSKASPYCKALILAILEKWMDEKRKKGEDTAIYMTYPQWVEEMYGLFSRCVVIDSVDELIGEGLISREKHKMYGKDTYKYHLNCQELNLRIQQLPSGKASKSRRDEPDTRLKVDEDASKNRRQNEECRLKIDGMPSKSRRNIESSTESINIKSERMNGESQQNLNVSTQQEAHSINQSSQNNSFSSQGTKPKGVIFSPEEEQVYGFAEKLNLVYLKKDENHRESCNTLIEKGVTTFEKLESLYKYCKQLPFYADKTLNLKNLLKELPGWAQTQEQKKPATSIGTYKPFGRDLRAEHEAMKKDVLARQSEIDRQKAEQGGTPDDDIIKKMRNYCKFYVPEDTNACIQKLYDVKHEFNVDNDALFDSMINAYRGTIKSGCHTIHAFFKELRDILAKRTLAQAS